MGSGVDEPSREVFGVALLDFIEAQPFPRAEIYLVKSGQNPGIEPLGHGR